MVTVGAEMPRKIINARDCGADSPLLPPEENKPPHAMTIVRGLIYFPAAEIGDQGPAIHGHFAGEDRLPSLGAPDEMVDDQMDPMFVPLILHVDSMPMSDMKING